MAVDMERAKTVSTILKEKRATIEALEMEVKEFERELQKANWEAQKELHAIYRYEVQVAVSRSENWFSAFDVPNGKEYVIIRGELLNWHDYQDFMAIFGSLLNAPKKKMSSVKYWRTDEGILTHSGGGQVLLKAPVLMTDEAWEELKAGQVEKFMK